MTFARIKGVLALTALLAGASAFAQSAAISSTPATLDQGNLRGATVSVTLTGATYEATADASHFTLATAVPGLAIYSVGFNSARTVASLRLHYDGSDFDSAATIAVTVAPAGTSHNAALATSTQAVSPARWVNVSKKTIALTEGGSNNTYTVVLESPPTANVTVTVASDNAAVTRSPATLTFTTQNWNTAQTVTVSPVDDNTDTVDEVALVANVASGGGYAASTVASRTVRVTVADDDTRTGTDYDTDDDQLIEIDSLAKLNAMRWDLDGNGSSANSGYATAFPSAAAGMGCPDGGDSNQTPDGCLGYELTANLDFDTNGNGIADSGDAYWRGGLGWDPIGFLTGGFFFTGYTGVLRGNGYTISNLYISGGATDGRGLFVLIGGRVDSIGLLGASITNANELSAPFAGELWGGTLVAVYAQGRVTSVGGNDANYGGLAGNCDTPTGTGRNPHVIASYADVSVRGRAPAGLVAKESGPADTCVVSASYAIGPVNGDRSGGLVASSRNNQEPTVIVRDSYWDRQTTGQTSSISSPDSDGLTTAELQAPTAATGIYAQWDDYDLDGDGRIDADDDVWDFGQANQYPVLKWGGHSVTAQFQAQLTGQTDTAPTYGSTTVADKIYAEHAAFTAFQIPAPTGGNGTYDYTVAGLPPGLVFDEDGTGACKAARTVCGTPTTPGERTVTVTVQDADANIASSDQARLTFKVVVAVSVSQNRPPQALGIADVALDVGETAEVDLDAAFSDPDGDVLRYAVTMDGDAAQAWASGATLRLRGLRPGEATGTATATDPDGLSASTTFRVAVGVVLSLRGSPATPEGGEAALTAELSRALESDVEVAWRLAPDGDPSTADADTADFAASAGTATIAAGRTTARIVLTVLDDDDIEPARERFAVELEEPKRDDMGLSARAWRALAVVQEGVCDRTPEVRAELSRGWRACHWPRPSNLAHLSRLDLRAAGATALQADDLQGLSRLRDLDLGGNALRELPAGLLSHTPRLRALRLDGNHLESLPAGLFEGVSDLRELRLAGNPGAPFALAPELRRTDADPWSAAPATLEAHLPLGAPFALRLALTVAGGEASAEALTFAAGAVSSGAVRVIGTSLARVTLAAPTIPQTRCGDGPCFDGLLAEGATLALFAAPPRLSADIPTADLLGAGDVRIDLSTHFAASGDAGGLTYTATVDDARLVSVSVAGSILTLTANEDFEEGTATVTVVATDEASQTATLRFAVKVSPRSPGRWRGWRSTIAPPTTSP